MLFGGKINMLKIYVPNIPSTGIMQQHNAAYRDFVSLGEVLQVTRNIEDTADFAVSEQEAWEYFDPFFKNNAIVGMPKFLCDKYLNKYYFAEAGMPIMYSRKFKTLADINYFENTPFILKPELSGGSMGSEMSYKIFENSKHFYQWCKDTNNYDRVLSTESLGIETLGIPAIVQKAVAKADEPYGQLYVEGFVNDDSEVYFSSVHEIEMIDGRWTKQLPWKEEDNAQLEQVLNQIRVLVRNSGVKNTMFLLQLLRNFDEGIWYPSDWQYRLSYNSLFGRKHFEPMHVGELVRYMANVSKDIGVPSKLKYYQCYVSINTDTVTKDKLLAAMNKYNIVNIPIQKNSKDSSKKFLFITARSKFADAEQAMLAFASVVS